MIERLRIWAALSWALCACALCAGDRAQAGEAPRAPAASTNTNVFPAAPQRDLIVRTCAACHAPEIVVAKHHTATEWDDIIAKMVDRGAVANEQEQQQILEYLVKFFGPA